MKILHILDHSIPLHSGYTFRTRNILLHQRALGWETCHITSSKHTGVTAERETVDGLDFYRIMPSGSLLEKLPVFDQWAVVQTLAKRLEQVVEIEKPDILHAHSPALNGLAALSTARKLDLPLVYECRAFWEDAAVDHGTSSEWGVRYRLTRAMESYVFRRANHVTTICEGLRAEIIDRGIDPTSISVIPNGVDIDQFEYGQAVSEELRRSLSLENKIVLGFIGSFYAYEGIPLLLDAMAMLKEQASDIALLLVGGGPQDALIREKISALGIENSVVLTGRVPHEQVQDYYRLVDLFVYPRLAMRLTDLVTPLKPLEAMAQGHLVLASDVGGHRELLRDSETGFLFQAGRVDSLVETITRVLRKRDSWPAVRSAARSFVHSERTWKNSVSRYQAIYERLL